MIIKGRWTSTSETASSHSGEFRFRRPIMRSMPAWPARPVEGWNTSNRNEVESSEQAFEKRRRRAATRVDWEASRVYHNPGSEEVA